MRLAMCHMPYHRHAVIIVVLKNCRALAAAGIVGQTRIVAIACRAVCSMAVAENRQSVQQIIQMNLNHFHHPIRYLTHGCGVKHQVNNFIQPNFSTDFGF